MASEIRVNTINNRSGLGTISITNSGAVFSGVTTFAQIKTTSGEVTVGTGASVFSPATNVLALGTNSAERVRITSDGSVGIGTDNASPGRLTVNNVDSASTPTLDLRAPQNGRIVRFKNNAGGDGSLFVDGASNTINYKFSTYNTTNAFYIKNDGNIGIGTDNPATPLHVEGNIRADGNLIARHPSATGQIFIQSDDATYAASINVGGTGNGLGYTTGQLYFNSEAKDVIFNTKTSAGESLRITSGGYVNIGGNFTQTNYTAQVTRIGGNTDTMQIKGNTQNAFIRFTDNDASSDYTLGADDGPGSDDNNFIVYDRNANAYRVVLRSDGNFGIGTNNPLAKLHVGGGNIRVDSGYGIDFSATSNAAGMTSQILDDYEEGTWTPDLDNAYVTTPGTSYNSRAGKYVRIGKMVLARFFMNIGGVTNSSVGPFFFGGLPFTHDTSDVSHRGLQASLYISGPNTPTGAVNVNLGYAVLNNGNYYLTLSTPIDDANSNNSRVIQASDISNGDVISGTIMYITSA